MTRVVGLGSDLLRIERIARIGRRDGTLLLDRLLAPAERTALGATGAAATDWPGCAARIARLFAAKEAFFKALGTGLIRPLRWADVAVDDHPGAPTLSLDGESARVFSALGGVFCRLALCGTEAFVLATVLLLGEKDRA